MSKQVPNPKGSAVKQSDRDNNTPVARNDNPFPGPDASLNEHGKNDEEVKEEARTLRKEISGKDKAAGENND